MPEMDGYELIRRVKASPTLHGTPVIATSASVYEADQWRSLAEGGDAFLPKPIDAERLLAQLQQLLGLEWQSDQPEPSARKPAHTQATHMQTAPEPTLPTLPPVATLEALHGLAVAGDIEALSRQLAELAQDENEYAPFVEILQQLAQEFRLRRIRELLKESLA